jgi:hypothetical protein
MTGIRSQPGIVAEAVQDYDYEMASLVRRCRTVVSGHDRA